MAELAFAELSVESQNTNSQLLFQYKDPRSGQDIAQHLLQETRKTNKQTWNHRKRTVQEIITIDKYILTVAIFENEFFITHPDVVSIQVLFSIQIARSKTLLLTKSNLTEAFPQLDWTLLVLYVVCNLWEQLGTLSHLHITRRFLVPASIYTVQLA